MSFHPFFQVMDLPQPLISKSSPQSQDDDDSGLSSTTIIVIILGVAILLCLIAIFIMCYREGQRRNVDQDSVPLTPQADIVSFVW